MKRPVLWLGALVLLLAGAAAFILLRPTPPVEAPKIPVAERNAVPTVPAAETTPEPVKPETAATPAEADSEVDAAATDVPEDTGTSSRTGRGRVWGHAALPADAPRGLEIKVELYAVPNSKTEEFTYDDAKVAEAVASPQDGSFEIKDLPYGEYVVLASAEGYTINSYSALSRKRPEDEVSLSLVPGGNIAGRVVNEAGEAVAGARIFVAGWNIQGQTRDAPRDRALSSQKRSDDQGTFTITNLRKSLNNEPGYKLAVKADGYGTLISDYFQAGTLNVQLVIKRGGVVSGVLINAANGEPLPDKTITVDSPLSVDNIRTTTDAEGFFFFSDVAPGTHTAALHDDDLVITSESAVFQVVADNPTEDVTLQAISGGKISGRVYDSDSGKGISGVQIYISSPDLKDVRRKEIKSTTDGSYSIPGLQSGTYQLQLSAVDGYPDYQRGSSERQVSARVGADASGIDFPLARGLTISGIAVDEKGKPVADADINGNAERGEGWDSDQTKADGRFELAGFAEGQTIQLWASAQGLAFISDSKSRRVTIGKEGVSGLKLVFAPEASISGIVVDENGKPRPNTEVYAQRVDRQGGQQDRSVADGSITIRRLTEGEYYFIFPLNGMWSDSGPSRGQQRVKVSKGEALKGVKILYRPNSGEGGKLTISGRVTNMQGQPISGARVQLSEQYDKVAFSDANGQYTMTGLGERMYALLAAGPSYSPSKTIQAKGGDTNANFVLKPLVTIEGRVVRSDTNQPVTSFRIRSSQGQPQWNDGGQFITVQDVNGQFRLTNVNDGTSTVEVRADGLANTVTPVTGATGGATVRDVLVRMQPEAHVVGRVLDSSGKGIAGAMVFVGDAPKWNREQMKRATTGADGSFRLDALPSGPVTLSAAHDRYAAKSVTVTLVANSESHVDIVLTAGGSIEGVITLDGKPVTGTYIHANTQMGESKQAQTDADGHYVLGGFPDGTVSLNPTVQTPVFRGKSVRVQVSDGLATVMNFDFKSGKATVEGVVYEAPGVPVSVQTHVSLRLNSADSASEYMSAQADADGAFYFEGVPAGNGGLQVYSNQKQKVVPVTIGDGQKIRKDIQLYGGSSLRVLVSGQDPGAAAQVLLLQEAVNIEKISGEVLQDLYSRQVGYAQATNGEGTVNGVEPGHYTVLVLSITTVKEGDDPYALAKWGAQQVDVDSDQQIDLRVQIR